MELKPRINRAYGPMIQNRKRYSVVYGGAGSGKSYAVAQMIILRLLQQKGRKVLIVRKVAKTIRFSVFALLTRIIQGWNLEQLFKVNKSEFMIQCVTGNSILFLGLDDVEKLKSIDGITEIWAEEASEIDEDDLTQLNLRIRGETEVDKQIILTFNPISATHWLKRRFFDRKDDAAFVLHTTYKHNAFLDAEYIAELEKLREVDQYYYDVYCLGKWGVLGNVIFSNFVIEDFPYGEGDLENVCSGMDFGFNHPSALERCGFKDGELYVFDELSIKGVTNTEWIGEVEKILPKQRPCTADSAEPGRIREFQQAGFNVGGAKKGKDSLKEGIDFLKRYRIHVHSRRCPGLAARLPLYKYKQDKDGNAIDEPVEVLDDEIAALRYAIEPLRLQSAPKVSTFAPF
jgi:phage terminase large subunit